MLGQHGLGRVEVDGAANLDPESIGATRGRPEAIYLPTMLQRRFGLRRESKLLIASLNDKTRARPTLYDNASKTKFRLHSLVPKT